jgi:preprotein translocase subunit SecE
MLGLEVVFAVLLVTAVFSVAAYLIDKSAERHEREEDH